MKKWIDVYITESDFGTPNISYLQWEQGHWVVLVLHVPGEGYQQSITFKCGSSQITYPKSRFPIGVIVFDELELCSYLCKSLSTASLFSFFHTKRNVILIKHNIRVYCIVCFPLLSIAFSCMSKLQLFYSVSAV